MIIYESDLTPNLQSRVLLLAYYESYQPPGRGWTSISSEVLIVLAPPIGSVLDFWPASFLIQPTNLAVGIITTTMVCVVLGVAGIIVGCVPYTIWRVNSTTKQEYRTAFQIGRRPAAFPFNTYCYR